MINIQHWMNHDDKKPVRRKRNVLDTIIKNIDDRNERQAMKTEVTDYVQLDGKCSIGDTFPVNDDTVFIVDEIVSHRHDPKHKTVLATIVRGRVRNRKGNEHVDQ